MELWTPEIGQDLRCLLVHFIGFPVGSVSKEAACSAADPGSIPRSGRSPGEGNGSILAWRILWTEEPGGLQSMGSQELDMT